MAGSYCTWIRAAGSLAIAIDGGDTTAVSLQRYCCQAFPNSLHSAVEQPCDCWSRAKDTIRPTIIVPENNTGFFNTLAGFFSRGRKKTSLAPSMSYWSIFERNIVGLLADFARSEFQRMANWPSYDFFNRKWMNCTKQALRFVYFSQFRFFDRNWASWPSVGIRACQIRPILPLVDSSRKLTNSSLREQGTILNTPGRKSLPKF